MKDFLKYTLATVVGLLVGGFILTILGLVTLVGLSMSMTTVPSVNDNAVLRISLNGEMTDRATDNTLQSLLGSEYSNIGLQQVLDAVAYAKASSRVKGIHLEAGALSATPAALQELRDALSDFKTSGKFITAYADGYTQGAYYVCSVADRVMLNPQGTMAWDGMSSETMFYKELLEKLGVRMQIFKVGTYKSAVEPYMSTRMSEANREQTEAYLHSLWSVFAQGVSASRGIAVDTLDAYASRGLSFRPAEELLACKMVDTLIYQNDVDAYINKMYNTGDKDFQTVETEVLAQLEAEDLLASTKPVIAVYYAEGGIDDASSSQDENAIHAPLVCDDLRALAEDDDVKAVVLRVNSPGGSAFGSEQIWHEVMNLKAKKPVIVSMGGYAASGGYYISCAADSIVAEPTTLTGSIGIFGMLPDLEGLAGKVGLQVDEVHTHRAAASLFRPLGDENAAGMQANIERGYALFVKRCAEGRGLTEDSIRSVAEGRVWTGIMARQLGLVDELGGLDTAVRLAAEKAGLDTYALARYPEPEDLWMKLLSGQWNGLVHSELREFLGADYESLRFLKQIHRQAPVQARLPYVLRLNL